MAGGTFQPTDAQKAAVKPWAIFYCVATGIAATSVIGIAVYQIHTANAVSRVTIVSIGIILIAMQIVQAICFWRVARISGQPLTRRYWYFLAATIVFIGSMTFGVLDRLLNLILG